MESTLLADELADKIKSRIKRGLYVQNERLTVRRLCEDFKVSETPVKQALNQLVAVGLVVAIPKCGIKVKSFDFEEMRHIWRARQMIEQYCAASAIESVKNSGKIRNKIKHLLEQTDSEYEKCAEYFTQETFGKLSEHDYALHKELVKTCGNPVIITEYENLHTHQCMFVGFHIHNAKSLRLTIQQHDEIVDALFSADLLRLQKAICEHIDTTIELYKKAHRNLPVI